MTPAKLEEILSCIVPKIKIQVAGVSQLVLRNVSAFHFVTLLPETHM